MQPLRKHHVTHKNLHSTMVLFKSFISQKAFDVLKKFTFHYGPIQILYVRYRFTYCIRIYIPLWSYSNIKIIQLVNLIIKFTFHYGPIQMNAISSVQKFEAAFTFHYGPIQIRCYCNTIIV